MSHLLAEERERYREVCRATLAFAAAHGYRGHNKHDALNSPLVNVLFGHTKWTRIAAIQAVMRAPINVRSLLGVLPTRNPKGLGLFANALLDLYAADGRDEDLTEAIALLDWLLANGARGFEGLSWGYPYPWQDLGFFAKRHYPNRVVTCWIGFSLVEAVRQTGERRYRDALPQIADFLLREPNVLQDDETMKCLSYVPDASVNWAVMDVPALVGAYLAEADEVLGTDRYRNEARRLLNWVADKQTDYGAWYYTHPSHDSLITHDNYHTAIILDCFDRYRLATGDDDFDGAYWHGLAYYRKHLFEESGAPRFMNNKRYPHDIHGSGSAILCFVRAAVRSEEYGEVASHVLGWTLANLYSGRGFFYYQKTRWHTKRFCLLRWANGWMSRALASVVRHTAPAS